MLIVALAAATAMALLGSVQDWIDRVGARDDKSRTTELARVAIDHARALLLLDVRRGGVDSLDDDWARTLPPLRHEDAEVAGRIVDAQGRLNLNNLRRPDGLIDERALSAYRRLLVSIGFDPALADRLADTLADALDADDSPRAGGAERDHYAGLGRDFPRNRPLEQMTALGDVAGYTPDIVATIDAHVTVLPGQQPVNINTASAEVLSALQPGLSLDQAQAIVVTRRTLYFRDAADFTQRLPVSGLPPPLVPIAGNSQHFDIRVDVRGTRARTAGRALVHRTVGAVSILALSLQ